MSTTTAYNIAADPAGSAHELNVLASFCASVSGSPAGQGLESTPDLGGATHG